jgi:hypothetical protein
MIVAILVIVLGFLPQVLGEPGLLNMPGGTPEPVGMYLPASAAFGGRALLLRHSFFPNINGRF